jgi:DNA-directed RNA polymerase omega subunit
MTARICSEKAAVTLGNRYDLVLVASMRLKELRAGYKPKINMKDNLSIIALTEIEEGLVTNDYLKRIR